MSTSRCLGPEISHDEKVRRRLQVIYAHQIREKQIFMEELKEYRRRKDRQMLNSIITAVGPKWYQALSVPQRTSLDTLEFSIYQDLLEGRPQRTAVIMRDLGLYPRPSGSELMSCLHLGRDDPKEMLAQLYLATFGYPIEGKRGSYCLNARLILSAIFYLGLDNLILLLEKTFAPDVEEKETAQKTKKNQHAELPSPYLETMVATLYEPPRLRRKPPPPMPNLNKLNAPYEEEKIVYKKPIPPSQKRLSTKEEGEKKDQIHGEPLVQKSHLPHLPPPTNTIFPHINNDPSVESFIEPPPSLPLSRRKSKIQRTAPSPYLTKTVAPLYVPPRLRRKSIRPMPRNLDELNEPYEEVPIMQKPPPPPPPPPPPKKRLPKEYCDELAGIITIAPHVSPIDTSVKKPVKGSGRRKGSSSPPVDGVPKKKYGIGLQALKKVVLRRRKPAPPTTGLENAQYTINGVFKVHGKTLYVLGNITILPAQGELIHGGHKYLDGQSITIHCGFRGWPPEPKPDPCDCVKKWNDTVIKYVKDNKCYCGHRFDFYNEDTFPADELPYFEKPTRSTPMTFNYHTIFDLDPQRLHIEKEFNKVWEKDSMLHVDVEDTSKVKPDKKKFSKKKHLPKRGSDTETVMHDDLEADGQNKEKYEKKSTKKKQTDTTPHDDSELGGLNKEKHEKKTVKKKHESYEDTDQVSSKNNMKMPDKRKSYSRVDKNLDKRKPDKRKSELMKAKKRRPKRGSNRRNAKNQPMNLSSKTCLGLHPKPQDYLKCALRLMRRVNVAARLPDLHLVPELKEWMRRRLYGRLTVAEKKEYLRKSTTYWRMFTTMGEKGFGHVAPPKEPMYQGHTTWVHKQTLNDTFRTYTHRYKLSLYRSHAYVTNLLWRSMYQAEFPDKKFREIYFSYLFGRFEDIQLIHPYSMRESEERKLIIAKKRLVCLPAGYEPKT